MNEYLARTLNEERRRNATDAVWREYCKNECKEERVHHPMAAD